jgi:hypothetical protein
MIELLPFLSETTFAFTLFLLRSNCFHKEILKSTSEYRIDLLEIGLNVVDWIGLAQDRYRWRALVNSVGNLRVP